MKRRGRRGGGRWPQIAAEIKRQVQPRRAGRPACNGSIGGRASIERNSGPKRAKNWLFLQANHPLAGLGDAGQRRAGGFVGGVRAVVFALVSIRSYYRPLIRRIGANLPLFKGL